MRVEVGYGLEGAIPDAVAKRITSDTVKPFFKRGDYAAGIEAGTNALLAAARREGFRGTGQAIAPRPGPVRRPVSYSVRPAGLSFSAGAAAPATAVTRQNGRGPARWLEREGGSRC